MFSEVYARRRRMTDLLGDRGQSLFSFLILGGLAIGSLGLFWRPWMPAAAPWGFALPLVYALGMLLIESRRQAAMRRAAASEGAAPPSAAGYDWLFALWSLACALSGLAAFTLALQSGLPQPVVEPEGWTPPDSVIESTIETSDP